MIVRILIFKSDPPYQYLISHTEIKFYFLNYIFEHSDVLVPLWQQQ